MVSILYRNETNKNNQILIHFYQSWNGLPPQYLTYSQSINGDIGKIKIQLFHCQWQRLIYSINSFMLQYSNLFDSHCFDFRGKEHLNHINTTNDNPSQELSIMNINFDINQLIFQYIIIWICLTIDINILHDVYVQYWIYIRICTKNCY